MKETRLRTKRWHPSQIMPIPDPQTQTRKRKWSQTENLADGAHELLPRYVFHIPVQVCDS